MNNMMENNTIFCLFDTILLQKEIPLDHLLYQNLMIEINTIILNSNSNFIFI